MLSFPNASNTAQLLNTAVGTLVNPSASSYISSSVPVSGAAPTDQYAPTYALYPPDSASQAVDQVAANEHAVLWGDPHIIDADKGKYDFQQVGNFNILQDSNININGRFEGGAGKPTLMKETGLLLGNLEVDVKVDGTATLGTGPNAMELQDGKTIQLADGSTLTKHGKVITADTAEYHVVINAGLDPTTNEHIDVSVDSKAHGVMSDGVAATGLLGESFDANNQTQTGTKLDPKAYQRASLLDNSTNAATQGLAQYQLAEAQQAVVASNTMNQMMAFLGIMIQMMMQLMSLSGNTGQQTTA
jgi:hypothetical protein